MEDKGKGARRRAIVIGLPFSRAFQFLKNFV